MMTAFPCKDEYPAPRTTNLPARSRRLSTSREGHQNYQRPSLARRGAFGGERLSVQEPKKRMKDKAAHACRALCCARVAEELQRRRGTRIGEHLNGTQHHRPAAGALSLARAAASRRPMARSRAYSSRSMSSACLAAGIYAGTARMVALALAGPTMEDKR